LRLYPTGEIEKFLFPLRERRGKSGMREERSQTISHARAGGVGRQQLVHTRSIIEGATHALYSRIRSRLSYHTGSWKFAAPEQTKKLVELGNFSRRRHLHLPGLVCAQKVPPADI
jgi:hypothetical protein